MAKTDKQKSASKRDMAKLKLGKGKPAKSTAASKKAVMKKVAGKKKLSPPPPVALGPSAAVLDRLWSVVMSRRDADPTVSHSARLLARGTAKVAQKFGEEAVECLIEAMAGNHPALIAESADVLYHLVVMWVNAGVRPEEVWAELRRREGISGIAEKAARPHGAPLALSAGTKKIP